MAIRIFRRRWEGTAFSISVWPENAIDTVGVAAEGVVRVKIIEIGVERGVVLRSVLRYLDKLIPKRSAHESAIIGGPFPCLKKYGDKASLAFQ
jgi:hypothetical protein